MVQTYDKRLLTEARGARVVQLPAGNSTDDTTVINAILAASAGLTVRGLPGAAYKISAPLIVRSGTTLDMSRCSVTLLPSSNSNLVQNSAVAPQRSVTDAAISSGATTVTSTSAAFTSSDVGRSIAIAGAGGNGNGPLVTLITAVTNGTTATVVDAATTTVSGATAAFYTRDSDITIVGGVWDRGANAGQNTALHSILLRHIDGLVVRDLKVVSTAGKYAVAIGDATNFKVRDLTFNTASDGVHINGPASRGSISDIYGTTADDFVALTGADYSAYQADAAGDITSISIRNLFPSGSKEAFKALAGAGRRVDGIQVNGVFGSTAQNCVWVGDDTNQAATIGGTYGTIIVNEVQCTPTTGNVVVVPSPAIDRLRLAGIKFASTSGTPIAVRVTGTSTATIGVLEVASSDFGGTVSHAVSVEATGVTLGQLVIDRSQVFGTGNMNLVYAHAGTITQVAIRDCARRMTTGNTGYEVTCDGATIGHIKVVNGYFTHGNNLVRATGGTIGTVTLTGPVIDNYGRVFQSSVPATTTIELIHPTFTNMVTQAMLYANGCTLVIRGSGVNSSGAAPLVGRAAAESITVYGIALPVDLAVLTKVAAGMATNTNAALSCGAGVVVCDGTSWKNLVSGTTY